MTNKISISIAIPVKNEEKNILSLIRAIYKQAKTSYYIDTIYVFSDGSTDNTVSLIRRYYKNIKVFDYKHNEGKQRRLNQALRKNRSEILIFADADIHFSNRRVFSEMVKKVQMGKNIGIVCSYHIARKPHNLIGKISYFGFNIWDQARLSLGSKGLRYYCEGGLIAFTKNFSNQIIFPTKTHVGDDSYSFYYAITNGFQVVVAKKAKIYIDLPVSLVDYINQMKRFLTDSTMVSKRFDKKTVSEYETMTRNIKINSLLKNLLKNPLVGILYVFIQSYVKLQMITYIQKPNWVSIKR